MADGSASSTFEQLFHHVPCGLLRTRADGSIVLVNGTFCRWTARSSEQLLGTRLRDLFTAGGRIFHHTHWLPILQLQGSISEVKLDVVTGAGDTIPMVLNAVQQHDGDDEFHLVSAFIARDRDQYERELLRARQRLQHAADEATKLEAVATDRALLAEQMVGIVSHDLRNPLATLAVSTQLLQRASLPDAHRGVVERMHRAVHKANRLISDLLAFSEGRLGGALAVAPHPCDLHAVVAEALDDLRVQHPSHQITHHIEGEVGCWADAPRLGQLLGNLVTNAATHGAPAGPITVTTTTGTERCSIAVHSEGEPIPAELHEAIFSPMRRVGSAASSAQGVGLGLHIVRIITAAHGGEVTLQSTAEAGTTFVTSFPARGHGAVEE